MVPPLLAGAVGVVPRNVHTLQEPMGCGQSCSFIQKPPCTNQTCYWFTCQARAPAALSAHLFARPRRRIRPRVAGRQRDLRGQAGHGHGPTAQLQLVPAVPRALVYLHRQHCPLRWVPVALVSVAEPATAALAALAARAALAAACAQ